MKLITFMEMCLVFDKQGYGIKGNADVVVIVGQKGRLVIPYGEIYEWKVSVLKKKVYELKRFYEDGDRNGRSRGGVPREAAKAASGGPAAGDKPADHSSPQSAGGSE